jgi:hypothetical protein
MNNRRIKVFLAHSNRDKAAVREIFSLLKIDGFQPWLDEESLVPGQQWELEVKNAVLNSDVFVVFLSKNSVSRKGYFNKEIAYALDIAEQNPEGTIFIVPIQLDECIVPERLGHLHRLRLPFSDSDFSIGATYLQLRRALISRAYDLHLLQESGPYLYGGYSNDVKGVKRASDWRPRWFFPQKYLVRGQNFNGTKYYGTASIVEDENATFKLTTFVGAQTFRYDGHEREEKDLRVLVFEGKEYTVVYKISEAGLLVGKWGAGGVEELIPASPFADIPEDK